MLEAGVGAQNTASPPKYTLKPTPKTVAWGYDAKTPPALSVKSGDIGLQWLGISTAAVITQIHSANSAKVASLATAGTDSDAPHLSAFRCTT